MLRWQSTVQEVQRRQRPGDVGHALRAEVVRKARRRLCRQLKKQRVHIKRPGAWLKSMSIPVLPALAGLCAPMDLSECPRQHGQFLRLKFPQTLPSGRGNGGAHVDGGASSGADATNLQLRDRPKDVCECLRQKNVQMPCVGDFLYAEVHKLLDARTLEAQTSHRPHCVREALRRQDTDALRTFFHEARTKLRHFTRKGLADDLAPVRRASCNARIKAREPPEGVREVLRGGPGQQRHRGRADVLHGRLSVWCPHFPLAKRPRETRERAVRPQAFQRRPQVAEQFVEMRRRRGSGRACGTIGWCRWKASRGDMQGCDCGFRSQMLNHLVGHLQHVRAACGALHSQK
mmetsp:Transcript_53592/g.149068  ORF Transcript_53592/g.149068 Transcript_53592/m.149068 type:complete len:346 (+) Transcript_53592:700-1737(+)